MTNVTGTNDADVIRAGEDDIIVYGGQGDDTLIGAEGNWLYGEEGNDVLDGGGAIFGSQFGGAGDDTYQFHWNAESDLFVPAYMVFEFDGTTTGGTDTLDLTKIAYGADNIEFAEGNTASDLQVNILNDGGEIAAAINLASHFDADGDTAIELLKVGSLTLDLTASATVDALNAALDAAIEANGNVIDGAATTGTLRGTEGNDTVTGSAAAEAIWAGAGDMGADRIDGQGGADIIGGGAGDDTLFGGLGADILFGGTGDDRLVAGDVDGMFTSAVSETAANQLWGGDGNDSLWGAAGADALGGSLGNDQIDAGLGDDTLYAGLGDDTLAAGAGFDLIFAGAGNDKLSGGEEGDTLFGGVGNDTLVGGTGNDMLFGGADADVFVFAPGDGDDVIFGFSVEEDTLDVTAFGFTIADAVTLATSATVHTLEGVDGMMLTLEEGDSLFVGGLTTADLQNLNIDY